ncbi:hypothetical protein MED222_05245 [Vibrio sp. MED222]|nr:hypothetical protein MED222_05245 [Vibrio sp. MED222]
MKSCVAIQPHFHSQNPFYKSTVIIIQIN